MKFRIIVALILALMLVSCSPTADPGNEVQVEPSATPYYVDPEPESIILRPIHGQVYIATDSPEAYRMLTSISPEMETKAGYILKAFYYETEELLNIADTQQDFHAVLLPQNHPLTESISMLSEYNVFNERYVLIGEDDAGAASQDISSTLKNIAEQELTFVGTSPDSPIYSAEMALWSSIDIDPTDYRWYIQGVPDNVHRATELSAYTFCSVIEQINLGEDATLQPAQQSTIYAPYVLASLPGSEQDELDAVTALSEWFVSDATSALISDFDAMLYGQSMFSPL